ncbi:LysM peptidoglycan-binding domain-containing protein [Blastopirellula sp. J2-11]|uniref:L,D-transpeptidase family protein n=1 Tax=Blastopirellula sp. J2-11 TaxID=2943192 RepID=UPI0021C7425D|nr:LysM peptidoglycan-binding domain-containing protein [Blastopirellula sp. J2-11]UUO07091.1 LysM peptidoglycan-binding domain-containing protein [Blastopirellula sp. J2-11]
METIKTACMVIVLMAVAYGVYHHLNQPEESAPKLEIEGIASGDIAPSFSGAPSPGGAIAPSFTASQSSPAGDLTSLETAPPLGASSTSLAAGHDYSAGHDHAADHDRHLPLIEAQPVSQNNLAESPAPRQPPAMSTYGSSSYENSSYDAVVSDDPASAYAAASSDNASYGGMEARPASANMRPSFESDWRMAQTQLEQNQWSEALRTLTPWRGRAELTTEQSEQLNLLLSQLAGSVVYSTEHLLSDPYLVQRGESLSEIAAKHQVPTILLQRINGISNPELLSANERLKVMQGPFSATVSLASREMTLTIDGCFAGKFPVTIVDAGAVQPGEHQVVRKEDPADRYGAQQSSYGQVSGGSLGQHAVYLDGGVTLHGETSGAAGSIQLSPRDAEDLFGILSVGSKVTIRR